MLVKDAKDEVSLAEIERILHSQTFRNAEILRVLLRFLGEKSVSGDAEQLKEYTIGIDALGKPATYDPRQDSGVRIQVGRLRQKLAEYYRLEGKDDPFVIDIPKGQFKVTCEPATQPIPLLTQPEAVLMKEPPVSAAPAPVFPWRLVALLLGALCVICAGWSIVTTVQLSNERRLSAAVRSIWTPELNELWRPFVVPDRPLIVAVATPLFVGFQGAGSFRDNSINSWDEAQRSPRIETIRKALNSPGIVPRHYTAVGEISAVFRLGRILTASPINVSVTRTTQVSQQQLSDSNVVFVGSPRVFADQLRGLPAQLEFLMDESGVQNLHPHSGEPARLDNQYFNLSTSGATVPDSGEVYAVVTHEPGPLGTGDILIFAANHSPGTGAAVEWFTQPKLAKLLLTQLRKPNGEIPRYYQVVLHVTFKDNVPTKVAYVMHRELSSGTR